MERLLEELTDAIRIYLYLSDDDGNICSEGISLTMFEPIDLKVEVESVWYSENEKEYYLHVCTEEFEGDIKISSLSDRNQKTLLDFFKGGEKVYVVSSVRISCDFSLNGKMENCEVFRTFDEAKAQLAKWKDETISSLKLDGIVQVEIEEKTGSCRLYWDDYEEQVLIRINDAKL